MNGARTSWRLLAIPDPDAPHDPSRQASVARPGRRGVLLTVDTDEPSIVEAIEIAARRYGVTMDRTTPIEQP